MTNRKVTKFQCLFDKMSQEDAIAHIVRIVWGDGYVACRKAHKIDNDPSIEIKKMLAAYEEYVEEKND